MIRIFKFFKRILQAKIFIIYPDSVSEGDSITIGNFKATFFKKPPFGVEYSRNEEGKVDGIILGPPEEEYQKWNVESAPLPPPHCPECFECNLSNCMYALEDKKHPLCDHHAKNAHFSRDIRCIHDLWVGDYCVKCKEGIASAVIQPVPDIAAALDGYRKADYAEDLENHRRRCKVIGCGRCDKNHP